MRTRALPVDDNGPLIVRGDGVCGKNKSLTRDRDNNKNCEVNGGSGVVSLKTYDVNYG